MSSEGKLCGKKALVTGSGTGIGREIALEFARQGADVALHYSHSSAGAVSAVEEIRTLGRRAEAFAADFAVVADVRRLGEKAVSFLGGLDCLVNNAGITFACPFTEVTTEQFDLLMSVNVRAQFMLAQQAVAHMVGHGGGAICNITSIHGLQGAPAHALYAATKGAIMGYTRSLAVEVGHRGVRVNAIAPGWVTVENYAKAIPGYDPSDEAREAAEKLPVARAGKPLDIAKLAAFLCSDDGAFVVGQTIVSDGGTTALMSLASDFRTENTAHWGAGYVPGV